MWNKRNEKYLREGGGEYIANSIVIKLSCLNNDAVYSVFAHSVVLRRFVLYACVCVCVCELSRKILLKVAAQFGEQCSL